MNFLSFLFYQSTVLSNHAVNGHQMYFGGSVVGKASAVSIEISPIPPLIFTAGGQNLQNLASFSTSLKFEPLAFENAARYPNAETNTLCRNDRPMSSLSLLKLVHASFENRLSVVPHLENCKQKSARSSITQPWVIRFRSNFVQSLNARRPKWCKCSRSRGQRSR